MGQEVLTVNRLAASPEVPGFSPASSVMLQSRIIACFALGFACVFGNATADDRVVVELHSGKRLRAHSIEHDPNSNGRIILNVGGERIQIQRNLNWNRVNRLAGPTEMLAKLSVPDHVTVVDAATLSGGNHEKVGRSLQFVPPAPAPELGPDVPLELVSIPMSGPIQVGPLRSPYLVGPDCCIAGPVYFRDPGVVVGVRDENPLACCSTMPSFVPAAALPEPRELLVSARAFNRFGQADWNSLEVSVQGRTADGSPCPVRGSLKCSLWVRKAWLVRAYGENYFEEPRDLVALGQWSQFLDGTEVDANGIQKVVFALPPQSPDHNLRLDSYGLMTATLDIPGQGRLATSSSGIALRQFDAVRGRSVVDYGSSLLPGESVSEGVNANGNWPAVLSGLRPDIRRFTVQP